MANGLDNRKDIATATAVLKTAYEPSIRGGELVMGFVGIPPAFDPAYMEDPETAMACIRACPAVLDLVEHPTRGMVAVGLETAGRMANGDLGMETKAHGSIAYDGSSLPLPNEGVLGKVANPALAILHAAHDLGFHVDDVLQNPDIFAMDDQEAIGLKSTWDVEHYMEGGVHVFDQGQDAQEHMELYKELPDDMARADVTPIWMLTVTREYGNDGEATTKSYTLLFGGAPKGFEKDISQLVGNGIDEAVFGDAEWDLTQDGPYSCEITVSTGDYFLYNQASLRIEPVGVASEALAKLRMQEKLLRPGEFRNELGVADEHRLAEKAVDVDPKAIYPLSEAAKSAFAGSPLSLDISSESVARDGCWKLVVTAHEVNGGFVMDEPMGTKVLFAEGSGDRMSEVLEKAGFSFSKGSTWERSSEITSAEDFGKEYRVAVSPVREIPDGADALTDGQDGDLESWLPCVSDCDDDPAGDGLEGNGCAADADDVD